MRGPRPLLRPLLCWTLSALVAGTVTAEPTTTPTTEPTQQPVGLDLETYVKRYLALSERLRRDAIRLQQQEVEIARARQQGTTELRAEPSLGLRHYRHTDGLGHDTLLHNRTTIALQRLRDNGQSWAVEAHANLPTKANLPAGNLQYGVSGDYLVPLWRNRGGRQFRLEAAVAEQLSRQAEATLSATRLETCQDAVLRFVEAHVAQQLLAVYRDLLAEKKRIWRQTRNDYRRRMITRLDLLAAKSDWLDARSQQPELVARVERAEAALRAFYPDSAGPLQLSAPAALEATRLDDSPATRIDEQRHPRFVEIVARQRALAQQQALLVEQNRTDLDLGLTVGLDRYHEAIVGGGATPRVGDTTDLYGLFSVRYLWPLQRPEVAFRLRLLALEQAQLEQQRAQLRRELVRRAQQAQALARRSRETVELITEQLAVAKQQIDAAYREFRAGKLQFQNFLDHWERYQRSRLQLWESRRLHWLAVAELIPLLNRLPPFCRP